MDQFYKEREKKQAQKLYRLTADFCSKLSLSGVPITYTVREPEWMNRHSADDSIVIQLTLGTAYQVVSISQLQLLHLSDDLRWFESELFRMTTQIMRHICSS